MPPEIWNLLVQVPIVVAFIWYSQVMNKQFQDFLREQREEDQAIRVTQRTADREVMERMLSVLNTLEKDMDEHDKRTQRAITKMEERTRPRPNRSKASPASEETE